MKDPDKRDNGKYESIFQKKIENVAYTITETTIIGRDFEVLTFTREYNPPMKV